MLIALAYIFQRPPHTVVAAILFPLLHTAITCSTTFLFFGQFQPCLRRFRFPLLQQVLSQG